MLFWIMLVLGVLAYFHIGYHLGDISVRTWLAKETGTAAAFLLFPVSQHKDRVGDDATACPIELWDIRQKDEKSLGPGGYKFFMTFLWPLKVICNIPAIVIYGVIKLMTEGPNPEVRVAESDLPEEGDDIQKLFEKRQAVLGEITVLAGKKKALDDEILRRKAEMEAVLEVEADVDPEVRKLLSSSEQS